MKKPIRLLLLLLVLALVLGALAYFSARWQARRITDAIEAIGRVEYSDETKARLDAADAALAAADENLHLEEKLPQLQVLKDAKVEYVKLAIKDMYLAIRDKEATEIIEEKLARAEEAFASCLSEEDAPLVKNYADLEAARAKYGPDAAAQPPVVAAPQPVAAPELCP